MNTADREREQKTMTLGWDASACVVTHTAYPLAFQESIQLPAKLGNFGSIGILLEEIRLQRIVLCE